MSAVLRWRCDICQREAEVVEEVPRGSFTFYYPKLPTGWIHRTYENKGRDVCSQRCFVEYLQGILGLEQRKLVDDAT